MVVQYPGRKRTGNRAQDVVDPLFQEAERLVHDWLLASNYNVLDMRPAKTYHDFRFGANDPVFTLDVKADQYAQTTGRVAWEILVENRGIMRPGWGKDDRLDYVAFVMPGIWRMILVDAERVRELLVRIDRGFDLPRDGELIAFNKVGGDGRTAQGIAIGIEYLRRHGAIKREDNLAVQE